MENPQINPSSEPQPSNPPRQAAVVRPAPGAAQVVYLQAAPNPFLRWLSWMGWIGCGLLLTVVLGMAARYQDYFDESKGIQEKYHSGEEFASDKIAIIEIEGVIGAIDEHVKKQIDRVKDDDAVRAIVVRVNSPGGTITGSDYIYQHLIKLREERELPMVVSMGSIAASGGYYVAMAVGTQQDAIFAEETTTTGSIGVIIPHYDLSGFLAKYDIKDDSIVSHPRKQMLSMTRPIDDGDRQVLESYMNVAFERFKEIIKQGRPKFQEDPAALDALATGEIFAATQAKEAGLVDRLGFLDTAIDRAAELANLKPESYRVVKFEAPLTIFDALTAVQAEPTRPDWQSLLELSSPKAYYLSTSAPFLAPAMTKN
jgi:protease-4